MHWIACVVAVIFHLCSKSIARNRALKPSCQCDALLPVTRTPKLPVSAADSYVLPFQTTSRPICCHGVSFKIFTIDPLSVCIGIGVPVWIVRNVPMFMSCHKLLQYLCLCWFNVKCQFVICPKYQSDSNLNENSTLVSTVQVCRGSICCPCHPRLPHLPLLHNLQLPQCHWKRKGSILQHIQKHNQTWKLKWHFCSLPILDIPAWQLKYIYSGLVVSISVFRYNLQN